MTDIKTALQLFSTLPSPPEHISGETVAAKVPLRALCCDSRRACPDALFVCIRGAHSDGHHYIAAAYEAGCRCFLVEQAPSAPLPPDACVFVSEDTRRDLSLLAAAYYAHPASKMKVVGITGTKGKTSVALMCHHVLQAAGVPSGYIGTCGVHYADVQRQTNNTTPGPLELQKYLFDMHRAGVQTVFLEVSSQALWQRRVDGISFEAVAMTNLSPDHIGTPEHPDFDHYAACKRRLLTDFGAQTVIVNADDAHTEQMLRGVSATVIRCGVHGAADVQAKHMAQQPQHGLPGVAFTYHTQAADIPVFLPLPGEHNVYNALFAITIAEALGISARTAAAALADVSIPGRFEMLRLKDALVVIDYAHNGASLRAALTTLRAYRPRRLLCLFGSVGERTQCRRVELGDAADELADLTYLTADNPGLEGVLDICHDIAHSFADDSRYCIIPDRAEAIRTALDELSAGDILLLAGKGDEQFQIIGGARVPYSDREVVERYLDTLLLLV